LTSIFDTFFKANEMAMATIGGTLTAASPSSSCLAYANDIKGESNFPQGCQFSPDGLCILTSTRADHTLRLYNTPPLTPTSKPEEEEEKETETQSSWNSVLKYQSGDSVRCYNWYPQMNSYDPSSCAFIASSRYVYG
jgi:WD40 repeat protein